MTGARWYARPEGAGLELRKPPRLASWNKATDPDQVRLRDYLEDTADLLAPAMVSSGPWALLLDVGLPPGRDLIDMADLDNYVFPLATRLRSDHLVSVWCTKRHAEASRVLIAPAHETPGPRRIYTARTTAWELPAGAVQMQLAFVVEPQRNWLTLWKPTIDALDPVLGRTRDDRDWHPKDGRITDLGLHVTVDPSLGHDVLVSIAATPAGREAGTR